MVFLIHVHLLRSDIKVLKQSFLFYLSISKFILNICNEFLCIKKTSSLEKSFIFKKSYLFAECLTETVIVINASRKYDLLFEIQRESFNWVPGHGLSIAQREIFSKGCFNMRCFTNTNTKKLRTDAEMETWKSLYTRIDTREKSDRKWKDISLDVTRQRRKEEDPLLLFRVAWHLRT